MSRIENKFESMNELSCASFTAKWSSRFQGVGIWTFWASRKAFWSPTWEFHKFSWGMSLYKRRYTFYLFLEGVRDMYAQVWFVSLYIPGSFTPEIHPLISPLRVDNSSFIFCLPKSEEWGGCNVNDSDNTR
ncbi:hypothetical protein M9H77_21194 [Catharanthus roseus]|uniref:Uncharacterized protein n=1 Tax=Catharanthus roseus TaxID=4058 RepID=A0ACC0AMC3_CATRO|nr:hypothetical protein M9H77_21194 [Catharanthus roseus]